MAGEVRVRSVTRHGRVQELQSREHRWLADRAPGRGTGLGPTPLELLLGSFAARTALGILDLAREREWAVDSVEVEVALVEGSPHDDVPGAGAPPDDAPPDGASGANALPGDLPPNGAPNASNAHTSPDDAPSAGAPDPSVFGALDRHVVVSGELDDDERRELESDVARRWPRDGWLAPGDLREKFTYP